MRHDVDELMAAIMKLVDFTEAAIRQRGQIIELLGRGLLPSAHELEGLRDAHEIDRRGFDEFRETLTQWQMLHPPH